MTHLITIFLTGYCSVFLLGFQSRLVNHGNFVWAAGCSFTIALAQGMLWKQVMSASAGLVEFIIYGLSGACAITSAMWVHRHFFMKDR